MMVAKAEERKRLEAFALRWAMAEVADKQLLAEKARRWLMGETGV
jgi:hypothetical protein